MPTRLLLDGEDLPTLMLRVKEEMGPDARIIRAERIRTGGIAGFFAKEHYELTVEVPDRTRTPRRRRPVPTAGTGARPAAGAAPGGAAAGGPARPAPVGMDALLAAADADDGPHVPSGTAFAEALEDELVEIEVEVVDEPVPAVPASTAAPTVPRTPAVSTSSPTFVEVLESMRQMVGPMPPVPAVPAGPSVPLVTSTEAAETPSADDAEQTPPAEPTPSADAAAADTPAADTPRDRSGSSVSGLLELGIPARLLMGFSDLHAAVPLSLLVRRFDPPPTLRLLPGHVVAVVGEGRAALRTAAQMAHRAGLDPFDIVLAGDIETVPGHGRRLQTAAAVGRYRTRVSSDAPTLMVIGVPEDPERWGEAAVLLDALDPDSAWAVLDARRKAVELRRWLRQTGGTRTFDAVAAVQTFEAQAPGTVLNLGVPVGWVDGLPASPVVWAAVLSERLADDARWD